MIYGSMWVHTGPYGWPEVNKNNVNNHEYNHLKSYKHNVKNTYNSYKSNIK